MCLAPQVDVIAGTAMAVVAVDAVRHCRDLRTAPLALLPAIFAFHTLTSAVVWWGLQGVVSASVGSSATQLFLAIAFVLWPVYLPMAILLIEPPGWRRSALVGLLGLGVYSSVTFLVPLLAGQGSAQACPYYIDFEIAGVDMMSSVLYLVATCGALLLARDRHLVLWGWMNVAAVGLLILMAGRGLPSLWCFWAACTSVFVAWLLRSIEASRARGEPPPWQASSRVQHDVSEDLTTR